MNPAGIAKGNEIGRDGKIANLLLVDDDGQLRSMLEQALTSFGYQVVPATDGETAVRLYEEQLRRGSGFDLVLLDYSLPEMDGGECLTRIRHLDEGARVLLTTGHFWDCGDEPPQARLATGVLHKPFALKNLLVKVQELLPA